MQDRDGVGSFDRTLIWLSCRHGSLLVTIEADKVYTIRIVDRGVALAEATLLILIGGGTLDALLPTCCILAHRS